MPVASVNRHIMYWLPRRGLRASNGAYKSGFQVQRSGVLCTQRKVLDLCRSETKPTSLSNEQTKIENLGNGGLKAKTTLKPYKRVRFPHISINRTVTFTRFLYILLTNPNWWWKHGAVIPIHPLSSTVTTFQLPDPISCTGNQALLLLLFYRVKVDSSTSNWTCSIVLYVTMSFNLMPLYLQHSYLEICPTAATRFQSQMS